MVLILIQNRKWLKSRNLNLVLKLPPTNHGRRIKHCHQQTEQFFYCLEGELHIEIDSKEYSLQEREGITVKSNAIHQVFNRSNQNVRFLVVSCPNAHEDRVDL